MKRLIAACALLGAVIFGLAVGAPTNVNVKAAAISTITGPQEPANLNATLNGIILQLNAGVGNISAQSVAAATIANTTETTLQQYTLPANALTVAGQGVLVTCWGTTGATANNKTRKLYFGTTSTITTAAEAANAQSWWLALKVMRTGAATQTTLGTGMAGTASVTPLNSVVAGTDALTADVLIKCTGTNGTAAANDIVANGMTVEVLK
jgi:hypothetical protein